MPLMGFETTIPVFERAKTHHALDRAATILGLVHLEFDTSRPIIYFSVDICSRFRGQILAAPWLVPKDSNSQPSTVRGLTTTT
jgi:hypothetical protein